MELLIDYMRTIHVNNQASNVYIYIHVKYELKRLAEMELCNSNINMFLLTGKLRQTRVIQCVREKVVNHT